MHIMEKILRIIMKHSRDEPFGGVKERRPFTRQECRLGYFSAFSDFS